MWNKQKGASLAALLLILVLVPAAFTAHSEKSQKGAWTVYRAKDVNLAGIAEKDGRLSGTIQTFRPKAEPRILYVDCPIPAAFTQDQLQTLTVEYKKFDKKAIAAALAAVGTDSGNGKLTAASRSWDARWANYQQESLLNTFFQGYTGQCLAAETPDPAHEKKGQMALAAERAAAFLKELGFAPYETGINTDRLYDPAEYGLYPQRSDWQLLQEELNRDYLRSHKKYNRTDFDYTVVRAGVTLRGLPVAPDFSWPEGDEREPDAIVGAVSTAILAVKDDGTITELELENLPVEKSAAPLLTPAAAWQDALREYIATYFVPHTNPRDSTHTDTLRARDFTEYASYSVLTEIIPVYMSRQKLTYTPAWCFVVEERLAKDDTAVSFSVEYLDAVTLTNISLLALN